MVCAACCRIATVFAIRQFYNHCKRFQENRTLVKQWVLLLFVFALAVNLGEQCDPESTDPWEKNAICDDYGICSKYAAVTTFYYYC